MITGRRIFLGATAAALTLSAPMIRAADRRPKVVVVGGGAGGATAARYIAKDSGGAIDVTLVEPARTYYTCFFSNLYLGGFKTMSDLGHTYERLATDYGVSVVHDRATGIDRLAKTVTLGGGAILGYDRLVLSPGIDFVEGSVPGWELEAQNVMPHAYKGGTQAELLKAQLAGMREGGLFVIVAPPNPYRCPPAPYERVSMVAWMLMRSNPRAKILIADPKDKFSKQALFEEAWQNHYGGMIERLDPDFGGDKVTVNPADMTVDIDGEVEQADVVNVIPAQKAGRIAEIAGVTDGDWAPVDPTDMSSIADPDIHVLGDASNQGDMPKSAFAANSQAKVCANAVRGALTGSRVFPAKYANACWSLLAENDGVKVSATYEVSGGRIATTDSFVNHTGEDAALRKATYEESEGWYAGFTADVFG